VYEEDIDSIFGAAHIRDALRAVIEHKGTSQVRELARKVLIVPENKDAGDLLTEFKKTKTHMAIVVDEYGGTRGMVTMEDLIEELVGDIADEHEIVEEFVQEQPDGSFVLDARIPLDEVNEKLDLEIEDEEFNTLGGHVFGELGREPKIGDEVGTDLYTLRVEEADRHRIVKVRLIKKTPQTTESSETDGNGSMPTANSDGQGQNGTTRPIESTK
jgi:CBS domain containing-hemolysin-like protein